ncbi:MAG: SMP-30/gluconolactonase/LRE family protein [bacterium]|nr:SMP-30/gluconolactonase/LRE family protein [bacterium]
MRIYSLKAKIYPAPARLFLLFLALVFLLGSGGCAGLSSRMKVRTVEADLGNYRGVVLVDGMNGCENLYLEPDSFRLYVTDLTGRINLIDGPSRSELKLVKSKKIAGECALGIGAGPDGRLYVAASEKDWLKQGGSVYRVDRDLEKAEKLTGNLPGINGLTFDRSGNLYLATSNMSFLRPRGAVYLMKIGPDGRFTVPEPWAGGRKIVNGMYFSGKENRLYFSETLSGVYRVDSGSGQAEKVFAKAKTMDFFDDLCQDQAGNLWVADPGSGSLKKYVSGTGELVRFKIRGIGQVSSCRIRVENGEEIIYLTELKRQPNKVLFGKFDGRGVFSMPLTELEKIK